MFDLKVGTLHPMTKFAALFLDVENLAYYLKPRLSEQFEITDVLCDAVRQYRDELQETYGLSVILPFAYADFERLGEGFQRNFFLMGIETRNVLGTDHKNASDMRLCIDAMATLYSRPEIQSFVLMGGDRDYIPLVQHLRQMAKEVLVCGFRANTSGDLLRMIPERQFSDALDYLSPTSRDMVERNAVLPHAAPVERPVGASSPQPPAPTKVAVPLGKGSPFKKPSKIKDENTLDALETLLDRYGDKAEIWLKPYLYELQKRLGHLAEYERKALISNMDQAGAIAVEKRRGQDTGLEYSVIVVNWDHPDVIDLNPG